MRRSCAFAFAFCSALAILPGCAGLAHTLEVSQCVVSDGRLSVALTDPDAAAGWLSDTVDAVERTASKIAAEATVSREDAKALEDAADVLGRLRKCVD